MLERFKNYIKNQALIEPDSKILLAVSGGVDSVVMTDLFAQGKYTFSLAHCQYNLRGEESDTDEAFVRDMATAYHTEVYVKSFDTVRHSAAEGTSIQMAARSLRYRWFDSLLANNGFAAVATAHHAGDLAETIILNLTRGTGIRGLHGIKNRQGQVIRPLLFATREEILSYARSRRLKWREDSSNAEMKYKRNEIRHKVIPVLKGQNPNLETRLLASSEKIAGAEAIMEAYVQRFMAKFTIHEDGVTSLSLQALKESPAPVLILHEIVRPYGFTYEQAKGLLAGSGETGRYMETEDYKLFRERDKIVIVPGPVETISGRLSQAEGLQQAAGTNWHTRVESAEGLTVTGDKKVAYLDMDKLAFPLVIRAWRQGDRFFPLGMKHQKKLSDFMIDEKIPLYLKDRVRVVCSGEDIVWVAGYRIDNRFRITDHTRKVFRIGML